MNPHNHAQQNRPSQERPNPPPILLLIKQQPDHNTPEDLRYPIHRIVQCPSLDVKQHGVIVTELPGVKVIAGKEHRKKEDDEWVCSECYPETFEFGFPRRVSRSRHSGTVGSDHFVWCCHYQGDYHTHTRQDEERDLDGKITSQRRAWTRSKDLPRLSRRVVDYKRSWQTR